MIRCKTVSICLMSSVNETDIEMNNDLWNRPQLSMGGTDGRSYLLGNAADSSRVERVDGANGNLILESIVLIALTRFKSREWF